MARERSGPLAFLLPDLEGGGVQRMTLVTAGALAERGYRVLLVLYSGDGPLVEQVPKNIERVILGSSWLGEGRYRALEAAPEYTSELLKPVVLPLKGSPTLPFLPQLANFLRRVRPTALFTATPHLNIEGLLARRLAETDTRIVISERIPPSHWLAVNGHWRRRHLPALMRCTYPEADAIVTVSNGVRDDLAALVGIPRECMTTIYNPAVRPDIGALAASPVGHPWFNDPRVPVVLAVGRTGRAKDYPTLLRAFARVREERAVRLAILGENSGSRKRPRTRRHLSRLVRQLKLEQDVAFLGHCPNPFAYMSRAALLASSSLYEGFGNAILEALACGCPVVSTNCPVGPAEILDDGRYGALVPVRDDRAMAHAISATLDAPPEPQRLRGRADAFSYDEAIDQYEAALTGLDRQALVDWRVPRSFNGQREASA